MITYLPLYHLRLRRLYDQVPVLILCVTQEPAVVDPDLSVLETILQPEFNVLAQRLAFLLCQARHNGKQHLTLRIHGVDVLFFKENRNVLLLQFPDIFQTIQGVSGKPTDGLGNDHINVSVHAVLDHAVQLLPLFRIYNKVHHFCKCSYLKYLIIVTSFAMNIIKY